MLKASLKRIGALALRIVRQFTRDRGERTQAVVQFDDPRQPGRIRLRPQTQHDTASLNLFHIGVLDQFQSL